LFYKLEIQYIQYEKITLDMWWRIALKAVTALVEVNTMAVRQAGFADDCAPVAVSWQVL
jgi:hypothetical protein